MTATPASPRATRADLDAYLQLLAVDTPAGKLIEIRYTVPGGMRQLFVPARRTDHAATAIMALAEHADVYTGVLLRARRGGGRNAVDASRLLFVEIDHPNALERLAAFPHAPAATVRSGSRGHVHTYFALSESIDAGRVKDANRRLAHALGGDLASTDPSRVLRPPSTVNRKHTPPAPVTLVDIVRSRRYDVDELLDGLADPPPRPRAAAASGTGRVARGRGEDPLLQIPAAEYIRRLTGREPDQTGKIACPFHDDRHPSMHLYPDGHWYCYGACQTGGSIYDFASRWWGEIPTKGPAFIELRERLVEALDLRTR
jgi:hypothetical protein